jgi:hypothetical protein
MGHIVSNSYLKIFLKLRNKLLEKIQSGENTSLENYHVFFKSSGQLGWLRRPSGFFRIFRVSPGFPVLYSADQSSLP